METRGPVVGKDLQKQKEMNKWWSENLFEVYYLNMKYIERYGENAYLNKMMSGRSKFASYGRISMLFWCGLVQNEEIKSYCFVLTIQA